MKVDVKKGSTKKRETVFYHVLDCMEVRELCIKKQFYTKGDNKAYGRMLEMCKQDVTVKVLAQIAQDIVDHTDEENDWLRGYEPVDEVMYYLMNLLHVGLTVKEI